MGEGKSIIRKLQEITSWRDKYFLVDLYYVQSVKTVLLVEKNEDISFFPRKGNTFCFRQEGFATINHKEALNYILEKGIRDLTIKYHFSKDKEIPEWYSDLLIPDFSSDLDEILLRAGIDKALEEKDEERFRELVNQLKKVALLR